MIFGLKAVFDAFSHFRGLGREALLLVVGQALLSFQVGVTSLIFPIYFAKAGLNGFEIGLVVTAGQLTAAVSALPFGILADSLGRKKIVLAGSFLAASSFVLYTVVVDFHDVLLVSFGFGVGSGMVAAPLSAWIANSVSSEKRNAVFSLNAAVSSAVYTVSSFSGLVPSIMRTWGGFGELDSYRVLIAVPAVLAYLSLPVFGAASDLRPNPNKRVILSKKAAGIMVRFGLVNALIGFGAGLVIPLFSYWFFLVFGVDETVLAPLFGISNVALFFSFLLAPKLAEIFGTLRTIVVSQAVSTVLLVVIPHASSYALAGVLYVVRGLLMNMANPLITSLIMGMISPDERATTSGWTTVSWSIPNAFTPSVGGYLMENVSPAVPFYLCGVFYATAIALFYVFFASEHTSKT
ncbi:MAG: MFS transporter [Candidatus Caldarchaeum sp.]|nr:MFS transporter [Candidatus Caldarchaeum sp.]MDW8062868.1 MFS transporter [Candidatus Caldarchaeum sp.]MDW8435636.1 MFS transporter [Candidatus Caldarchaeum sp.]